MTAFKYHIWKEYKLRVWLAVAYVILVSDQKKWNCWGGTRCEEGKGIVARASKG